jgi:lysozyme family protein
MDVWIAPQSDIETIYHDEYWEPLCDTLPNGVDYIVFNNNVLDGPVRSTILLQQALGVTADGRVGPITREAIRNANPAMLITSLSNVSRNFYLSLHQPKFIKGWLNRVASVNKNALALAATNANVA